MQMNCVYYTTNSAEMSIEMRDGAAHGICDAAQQSCGIPQPFIDKMPKYKSAGKKVARSRATFF